MFFYLSKILLFLIKPLVWLLFIAIRGIFTKDETKRKRRLIIATLLLFLLSNNFLINELGLLYESKSSSHIDSCYDVGIVLGGFAAYDKSENKTVFYDASDRLLQAIALLKKGKIKRLMISSGSGSDVNNTYKEADAIRNYLHQIGIPDSLLIIENNSRNTIENAKFSYKILDSMGIHSKALIITSAWHIPRAKLCFNNKNKIADFYATNAMSSNKRDYTLENILVPNTKALGNLELLVKEWIGYIVYYVKF